MRSWAGGNRLVPTRTYAAACGCGSSVVGVRPRPRALITPTSPALTEPLPERVVMCFFPEVLQGLPDSHGAQVIGEFSRELGGHTIYRVTQDEIPVAVFHPGVGAPLAMQHFEGDRGKRPLIRGVRRSGRPPARPGPRPYHRSRCRRARRRHLLPLRSARAHHPSRPDAGGHGRGRPGRAGIPWTVGMTWTTDAPFRETPVRCKRAKRGLHHRRDGSCGLPGRRSVPRCAVLPVPIRGR